MNVEQNLAGDNTQPILQTLNQYDRGYEVRRTELNAWRLALLSMRFRFTFPTALTAFLVKATDDAHFYLHRVVDKSGTVYEDGEDRGEDIDAINALIIDLGCFPENHVGEADYDYCDSIEMEGEAVSIDLNALRSQTLENACLECTCPITLNQRFCRR